ncbi:MAG: hypothetical protein COV10_00240 [Candidatus Vogelbacteria bacterium CG10_big_fil_rev_8_21_14_0_10_51_16]|uniref:DUF3095 domain-containing protein n=1 Tax=Candidatus Vogelbacteria bacterium CG10_big_fil_rev_8_21_14_0_10_51_16 TaxID=1975045 RepID=A0A2H0RFH9_9BACT|nr:MAG: hypothetical protein COV10_00240 [Candidatus Vogelbacteria bacterium CG10_big_fil_rev_8_21_14_0_10_51_16]
MNPEDFYKSIPALEKFADVADFSRYVPAPDDWYVVVTDIKGSTKAVEAGKYKEVNAVGAASIIAVLNVAKEVDIPFVFGGDGATMLIPPTLVEATKGALAAARELSLDYFELELRVGLVPLTKIPPESKIRVAKFRASPHYHQAMFAGNGVVIAEKLIKDPATNTLYEVPADHPSSGQFRGFECRWNDIASPHGETVALLVKVVAGDIKERAARYCDILAEIERIYGSEADYHPITVKHLTLVTQPPKLNTETYIRAGRKSGRKGDLERFWYRTKIWLTDLYVNLAMRTPFSKNDFNLSVYKNLLVATCDFRKYDDALRMILAGTPAQRRELEEYLEELHRDGTLAYGTFATDRALMTCLVFERYGKQVHFIDGADGGYTRASKPFKERLKKLSA